MSPARRPKTDVLVYHARNYRDIVGDRLRDPNRHARAQAIRWRIRSAEGQGEPRTLRSCAIRLKPMLFLIKLGV
jgi:GH43 family beta-xylosidase